MLCILRYNTNSLLNLCRKSKSGLPEQAADAVLPDIEHRRRYMDSYQSRPFFLAMDLISTSVRGLYFATLSMDKPSFSMAIT